MNTEGRTDSAPRVRASRLTVRREWWQEPGTQALQLEARPSDCDPRLRLRLGDGVLDVVVSQGSVLDTLHTLWGDSVETSEGDAAAARIALRVVDLPDAPCVLMTFSATPGLDLACHALDLLSHLYLGANEKFLEIDSGSAPWRMIAAESDQERPVIAAHGNRILVDVDRQPINFIAHFVVSLVMRAQRGVIFVHAASVAIGGVGVLLAGPSGAGKTTLSLGLTARGHDFYGDNVAGLRVGSAKLVPFRRTALLRPGVRPDSIDRVLAEEGVDLSNSFTGPVAPPKTPFRTACHFPPASNTAVPLRCAFFLRGFTSRPAVEAFVPTQADFNTVLRPLVFDILVAASWGAASGWLIRHLQLLAMLSRVHCFHLDIGRPEETMDLIQATVQEGS